MILQTLKRDLSSGYQWPETSGSWSKPFSYPTDTALRCDVAVNVGENIPEFSSEIFGMHAPCSLRDEK
jgi:hypothetical protein